MLGQSGASVSRLAIISVICILRSTIAYASTLATAPSDVAGTGYSVKTTLTFTEISVDIHRSGASGFAWYPYNFFGSNPQTRNILLNGDGSVTLNGDTTGPNGELATAIWVPGPGQFVGTAFGGGAYIEATIKFDPNAAATSSSNGWPSFWSLALEHAATNSDQWIGKPNGFLHFIEADFFEYDLATNKIPVAQYGATMHDWYGIYKNACLPQALCDATLPYEALIVTVPETTNFNQYHRYGFLWIPATSSQLGHGIAFFDGAAVGAPMTWTQYTNQPGVPNGQPWQFGIIDQQHLVLILGTGLQAPMTVKEVDVWQATTQYNMHK